MITRDQLLKIGVFNKPHGIHGEISFTFTDDAFDRCNCDFVVCEIDGIYVPFYIEEYRFRGEDSALMKLEDISSDTDARLFTLRDVFIEKKYLSQSSEDEFSAPSDFFIGFTVVDSEYGELGKINEVDTTTLNTLFVIDRKGEELLIPAADEFVLSIDEINKIITMNIPEGIID